MKISVALCTYNGERFISEQLESIAAQTHAVDEIIICDDRSDDSTPMILQEFAARSRVPVRVFFNEENLGSSRNFEKAIGLCTGEVIFLSDQDDIWMPDKVEHFMKVFANRPKAGLVFSDAQLVNEELRQTRLRLWQLTFRRKDRKRFRAGDALGVLLVQNVVTGAAMAFRAELRDVCLPISDGTDMIHDGWISLMAAVYSEAVMIDRPLLKYRQHSGQQLGALLPKLSVPIRERHAAFIENRRMALQRLRLLKGMFSEARESSRKPLYTHDEMVRKITEAEIEVECSIVHFTNRAAMPAARMLRLPSVIRELFSGRYHRHTKGFASAAMDLLSK